MVFQPCEKGYEIKKDNNNQDTTVFMYRCKRGGWSPLFVYNRLPIDEVFLKLSSSFGIQIALCWFGFQDYHVRCSAFCFFSQEGIFVEYSLHYFWGGLQLSQEGIVYFVKLEEVLLQSEVGLWCLYFLCNCCQAGTDITPCVSVQTWCYIYYMIGFCLAKK